MPKPVRISLDAMGGDHGPSVVIPGAALALERHPDLRFLMFGNETIVAPLLNAHPKLKEATELRHTDIAIAMDEKPSQAIRMGRGKSSMWRALQARPGGGAGAGRSVGDNRAPIVTAQGLPQNQAHIARPG